jgi:hypothetical protein
LDLLKKGVIWRIGSGSKVKIFRDNWIPHADVLKAEGRRNNSHMKWVSELINPQTCTWDDEAVRDNCMPHDARAILSIKLPARACDDFIAWNGESNGLFTVRSAYQLGLQPTLEKLSHGQSISEPSGERSIWNLVWKAVVPQKLWVFAWKTSTSNLEVRTGLHRRMPEKDPVCTICGCEEEDDYHALV